MHPPSGRPKEGSLPLSGSARGATSAPGDAIGSPREAGVPGSRERRWTAANGVHIDVRGLVPPGPLVAIVALIESIGGDATAVFVHHERDPVLLYGELAERGWCVERVDSVPGEVLLKLERVR